MNSLVFPLRPGEAPGAFSKHGPIPPADPAWFSLQRPAIHLAVVDGEDLLARASLWWNDTPSLDRRPTAWIGHFEAAGERPAEAVLQAAKTETARAGCAHLAGPMDGSTWFRYRWVTDPGEEEPPFLMEPWNPPEYPQYFRSAGFREIAAYESSLLRKLKHRDPRLRRVADRMDKLAVEFAPIRKGAFEDDLRDLHALSLAAFRNNAFYTPISESAFLALYQPFRERFRPEFTCIARHQGRAVGFCFCLPDFHRPAHGHPLDTLVVKSLAVLPDRAYAGLGSWMTEQAHHRAQQAGMTRVIHALKAATNTSQAITAKYPATRLRLYHVFSVNCSPM